MLRFLLLLTCSTAAWAQLSVGCDASIINPVTGTPSSSCAYPFLNSVSYVGPSDGGQVYQIVGSSFGTQPPTVCLGEAAAYYPPTNSFLSDRAITVLGTSATWVPVCRPATIVNGYAPQSLVFLVSIPFPLAAGTGAGIPPALIYPMVMVTNNDTGASTVQFFDVSSAASGPSTSGNAPVVNQVTPLGVFPGTGLPRYQLNGSFLEGLASNAAPPTVQILTEQYLWLGPNGNVFSRTSAPLANPGEGAVALTAWLPVQQLPAVISASPSTAVIQTPALNPYMQRGLPVALGYLVNQGDQVAPFSFVP